MFKCALQVTVHVKRLSLSAAAAQKHSVYINSVLRRRDRPHNIGITTLLFARGVNPRLFKVMREAMYIPVYIHELQILCQVSIKK